MIKVALEGVMQVKEVVYSRALKRRAARHISELKEASGAGAEEELGPNRVRQKPWSNVAEEGTRAFMGILAMVV